jgi:hypothetical protein
MANEIFEGLLDVFNSTGTEFLTLEQITRRMISRGFYANSDFNRAKSDVLHHLNSPLRQTVKGDKWWLPPSARQANKKKQRDHFAPLEVGEKISHEIHDDFEINNGAIHLRGNTVDRFESSLSRGQRRNRTINIVYYGTEHITCSVIEDNRENKFLKSSFLRKWFEVNGVVPGDKIWLIVEHITPLEIRLYTAWERNSDAYRKYRQSKNTPSVDLPIRDIIWDFLVQSQKVSHRREISDYVIEKRPTVRAVSVDVCLGSYPDLFVRLQRGYWGLKEWNLEQVIYSQPNKSGSKNVEINGQPLNVAHIDEILANIVADDLVFRILESTSNSLKASEITEKVAKNLGIEKSVLERTTFINVTDSRIIQLEDGSFMLRATREEFKKIIEELGAKERQLNLSLETITESFDTLKTEVEKMSAQYSKKIEQIENERDNAQKSAEELLEQFEEITNQWDKRTQLLSNFFTEAIPLIGQSRLKEIFEHLRHNLETRDSNESI